MEDIELEMIDDGGCAANEPFALRVLGDSMEPEFPDGCVVIIEPTSNVKSGSYVMAEVDGEYIFRLFVADNEKYLLKPLNAGYPTLQIENPDAIKGLITQRSGTRRRDYKRYI